MYRNIILLLLLQITTIDLVTSTSPIKKPAPCLKKCGKNQVYKACGTACPLTCDKPKPGVCTKNCVPGCFCIDGYVLDSNNTCVPIEKCPCKENEEFTSCGTACPDTCDNYKDTCRVCTRQCVPGCFCKKGFVRDANGKCIDPKNCPYPVCSLPHEYYAWCPPTCPPTDGCALLWSKYDCRNASTCCKPKCRCEPTYFRNNDGICVTAEQCMKEGQCGDHAHFDACANCPKNAQCLVPCEGGCICDEGWIKNANGVCIKQQPTKPDECPKNSHYNKCSKQDCRPGSVCVVDCLPGCFCDDGYVWNEYEGLCVKKCPIHSHYDKCTSKCPPDALCKTDCIPGCVCDDGYVWREYEGICVKKETPPVCKKNEHFEDCGTACPLTCDNPNPGICTLQCVVGCFCDDGYVKNKDGDCVPINECPPPKTCPLNEHFEQCGTACPSTCNNPFPKVCIKKCVSGCFCDSGYLRNKTGYCVPGNSCPEPVCETNQTYVGCAFACPTDYCPESNGPVPQCLPQNPCPPGCRCKPGYLKKNRDDPECILKEDCAPKVICGEDEHYESCGTDCPPTCDNPDPKLCDDRCVRGCFCNGDLVRNKWGECVSRDMCYEEDDNSK